MFLCSSRSCWADRCLISPHRNESFFYVPSRRLCCVFLTCVFCLNGSFAWLRDVCGFYRFQQSEGSVGFVRHLSELWKVYTFTCLSICASVSTCRSKCVCVFLLSLQMCSSCVLKLASCGCERRPMHASLCSFHIFTCVCMWRYLMCLLCSMSQTKW